MVPEKGRSGPIYICEKGVALLFALLPLLKP
jgi:hypothetical protein